MAQTFVFGGAEAGAADFGTNLRNFYITQGDFLLLDLLDNGRHLDLTANISVFTGAFYFFELGVARENYDGIKLCVVWQKVLKMTNVLLVLANRVEKVVLFIAVCENLGPFQVAFAAKNPAAVAFGLKNENPAAVYSETVDLSSGLVGASEIIVEENLGGRKESAQAKSEAELIGREFDRVGRIYLEAMNLVKRSVRREVFKSAPFGQTRTGRWAGFTSLAVGGFRADTHELHILFLLCLAFAGAG